MSPIREKVDRAQGPRTALDVLSMLEMHHQGRRENYKHLAENVTDERVRLLLDYLRDLENGAINVIREERSRLQPDSGTFLPLGPTTTADSHSAVMCRCVSHPTIDDAVWCALTSDDVLDELIALLASSSAALSVQELTSRLRELEQIRARQVANFVRTD